MLFVFSHVLRSPSFILTTLFTSSLLSVLSSLNEKSTTPTKSRVKSDVVQTRLCALNLIDEASVPLISNEQSGVFLRTAKRDTRVLKMACEYVDVNFVFFFSFFVRCGVRLYSYAS